MKHNKKVISIILSIILIISMTTTILIATANAKKVSIAITTDKAEFACGESATVSVRVTADCTLATMSIPVFYDKTLVDVSEATATLDNYAVKNAITDNESAEPSKIYNNTGINSDKFGFVLVNYIGSAGSELTESTDSVVLTFKITAKADVSGNVVVKCIKESAKTESNIAGMLYFGSMPEGTTIDEIPENLENIDLTKAEANVAISTGSATLIANNELTGFIDAENNYIYGIPAGTSVEDLAEYFTVSNGVFEMVANEGGYTNGTGATLVVKDTAGNEVTTYTLIVFGDVNGDGSITMADYGIVSMASLGGTIDGEANNYAADVNGDASITMADYGMVSMASLGGEITVNPYEE